jgi:2-octaprenyl-6-methoxyphenol hydroxylase
MQMQVVTDVLNRLFSNDLLPLKIAREVGLAVIHKSPFLKKLFTHHAMGFRHSFFKGMP